MTKSCPSCQAPVKKKANACSICGWKFEDPAQKTTVTINPATRPKIQVEIEQTFTIDRTASSKEFAEGIPATAEMILRHLETKTRSIKCRVQTHGDQDEGQMPMLEIDEATVDEALDAIRKVSYEGGGDPAEHHLDAIEHLFDTTPWTLDPSKSRGAIVAFLTADSKPATTGSSPTEIGKKIKDQGVLLYLVCQPSPSLKELVDAADGLMFEITNHPDPQELHKIASQLASSIVSTVGSGATTPLKPVSQ